MSVAKNLHQPHQADAADLQPSHALPRTKSANTARMIRHHDTTAPQQTQTRGGNTVTFKHWTSCVAFRMTRRMQWLCPSETRSEPRWSSNTPKGEENVAVAVCPLSRPASRLTPAIVPMVNTGGGSVNASASLRGPWPWAGLNFEASDSAGDTPDSALSNGSWGVCAFQQGMVDTRTTNPQRHRPRNPQL
jgi:hypothetical protein